MALMRQAIRNPEIDFHVNGDGPLAVRLVSGGGIVTIESGGFNLYIDTAQARALRDSLNALPSLGPATGGGALPERAQIYNREEVRHP